MVANPVEFIKQLFSMIFGSLFHLNTLSTCAVKMDYWVIGQWIVIFMSIVLLSSRKVRYFIGEQMGLTLFIIFWLWTVAGGIMLIYTIVKSPGCLEGIIIEDMIVFTLYTVILFVFAGFAIIYSGLGVFNKYFHSENKSGHLVTDIKYGKVDALVYIRANKDIDNYVLFKKETDILTDDFSTFHHLDAEHQGRLEEHFC